MIGNRVGLEVQDVSGNEPLSVADGDQPVDAADEQAVAIADGERTFGFDRESRAGIPSGNKQDPRESREEKPIVRRRVPSAESSAPRHFFVTISDVPSRTIREVILEILRRYGQIQRQELFRAVARELGFFRTSKNIQNHIGRELDDLIRTKDVTLTEEGRLWAS